MNAKRLTPLLIMIVILSGISMSAIAHSENNEMCKCYSRERSGLLVEIEVTALAWPGNNVTISIKAVATQANIHIRYIHINVSSLKENRSKTLLNSTAFLVDQHLNLGELEETSYEVFIHNDTLPGLLYGEVEYGWSIEGDEYVLKELNTFPATYIQNKPYEDLRQAYDSLNNFCNDLQGNYTSLEANYTDLQQKYQELSGNQIAQNNSTGLMYLFIITTAIFVVTTILLLVKRPKTATW